jgi:beta-1,4-mannooligosaccharide phosphorylase
VTTASSDHLDRPFYTLIIDVSRWQSGISAADTRPVRRRLESGPRVEFDCGYVPNVVYSCGALVHRGTLVLPYGIGDAAIGVATVPLGELLAALKS